MSCIHPAATITDHAVQGYEGTSIRYAWRGACDACRRGVVGVTAIPSEVAGESLTARLTNELMSYLALVAAAPVG